MLLQMINIVKEYRPDVFLICGDVYHTPQPSAAVQTMLTNALMEIHKANPEMVIVMTAGNHDSSAKHEIFRVPWRELNVYAVGQLEREMPEEHIIEVPGKGYVIAVPYCHERNIPDGFFQQLSDLVKERNSEVLPVVMTAHTTVKGCDFTGHENASDHVVGGIDAMDLQDFGDGYDYLALGHIHHGQFIHSGKHNVRYCGTPLAISFDENYAHTVSIVEIERHGEKPVVKEVGIESPHPLVTLPTEGFASWEEAKDLLSNFPNDNPAFIRLNVEIDDFLPSEAHAEAELLTEFKSCRFCCINAKRRTERKSASKILTVQEFQEESPLDVAKRYTEDLGMEFNDEMKELFEEAVRMIEEESRQY